MKHDKKY